MKQVIEWFVGAIRWLLLAIIVIFFLLLALVGYFTATEVGYRQLPAIISALSPYEIHYRSLEGHLWTRQKWQDLSVHGPGIDLDANTLVLNNRSELWSAKIDFSEVLLADANIALTPSANENKDKKNAPLRELPQVSLPFDISLQDITLQHVHVVESNNPVIDIEKATLALDYVDGHAHFTAALVSDVANLGLSGEVTTLTDYPLTLQAQADIHQLTPAQQVILQVDGSVLAPEITVDALGYATGQAALDGKINLADQVLDLHSQWAGLQVGDVVHSKHGQLSAQGHFDDIALNLLADVTGQNIPNAQIDAQAQLSNQGVRDIALFVDTLGGQLSFNGSVAFTPEINWQGQLVAHDIDSEDYLSDLNLHLNAQITTEGNFATQNRFARLTINELDGVWQGYPIDGGGEVRYSNEAIEAKNFHLALADNIITAKGVLGQQDNSLEIKILAEKLDELLPSLDGGLKGKATLSGAISNPLTDGQIDWQSVAYFDTEQNPILKSSSGFLQFNGRPDAIKLAINANATGKDFPLIDIEGTAVAAPERIDDIDLMLHGGEGKAHVAGEVQLQPNIDWSINLSAQDFDSGYFFPEYPGQLNANIASNGRIEQDGQLNTEVTINKLNGSLLDQPLSGSGSIRYDADGVYADKLILDLASNKIQADGVMDQRDGELQVDIDAQTLSTLVPNVTGRVQGEVILKGRIDNPDILADIDWAKFSYRDPHTDVVLFESQEGTLQAKGSLDGVQINTKLSAKGQQLSKSAIEASALVSAEQISDINLTLNAGDGRAEVKGNVDLKPEIQWAVNVETDNLNPATFVDGYRGQVNASLSSAGRIDEQGKVNADAHIHELNGTLNGATLDGKGRVDIVDGNVSTKEMKFSVGDNDLAIDGGLTDGQLDLSFDLKGRDLSSLYPPLKGKFSAKGVVKGDTNQPDIELTASANNIAYQEHRIQQAEVRLSTGAHQGGSFDNSLQLSGVDLAGQHWDALNLRSKGRFEQHTLSLESQGGAADLSFAANGGFAALNDWSGKINTLAIKGQGMNWHLRQASNISIAPQNIKVDDFCLSDDISAFCIDAQHDDGTYISYQIEKLTPKSLAQLIPDMIHTGITAQGKGDVRIAANGRMRGQADIEFTPGTLVMAPEGSPPITLNLQKGTINAAFQGEQINLAADVDFAEAGTIKLTSKLENFSAPKLDGHLTMDIPDIGEFRYLVPKVSEMRGAVHGDLNFGGPAHNPIIGGQIALDNGYVIIPKYSTQLDDIKLVVSAQRSGQIDINGQIGTPKGDLNVNGILNLIPLRLQLNLDGKDLLIADAENMRVLITPTLDVTIDPENGIALNGELLIPEARISIPDTSGAQAISDDVVILGKNEKSAKEKLEEAKTPFNATINVVLGDKVYFHNSVASIRLLGGIKLFIRPNNPIAAEGVISVASGIYTLYGQELEIKRGKATFSGRNIANPVVEVLALREIDDVDVGARISGSVDRLQLNLTSNPAMPDSAILSYLLFGRAPDAGTDTEGLLETAASFTLGGVFPDDLSETTGLDVLDIGVTGVKAGKYLGDDLYVGMRSNFFSAVTQFLARYQFSERLKAEATASTAEKAVDFIYEYETD